MARDLPPRMLRRTRQMKSGKLWVGYYYDGREGNKRKEIPLGTDLNAAKRKWAELERCEPYVDTTAMKHVFDRYEREIIPARSPRTQREYLAHLAQLRKAFDDAPIESIKPMHVAQFRDARTAKVSANREISRLSHVWNKAREWGFTDRENPCRGVEKNTENGRNFYADDAVFDAIREHAVPELRDALDLAYLTGQRPADVCKMKWSDIVDGAIEVTQNKTSKRLKITIEGELLVMIERIKQRSEIEGYGSTIIATKPMRWGTRVPQKLTDPMRRDRLAEARIKAHDAAALAGSDSLAKRIKQFQFRDTRSKAASDIVDIASASKLLGHTKERITKDKYRRNGESVRPVK